MGIFGWDLPPGVSVRDLPGNQPSYCQVCTKEVDSCICPECPQCQVTGEPTCYRDHELLLNRAQIISRQESRVAAAKEALDEEQFILEEYKINQELATDLYDSFVDETTAMIEQELGSK